MNVEKIIDNPTQIIALTSLSRDEFELLLAPFSEEWYKWFKHYDFRLERRKKPLAPGQLYRPTKTLPRVDDKLFFILYHFKNNHLQQDLAAIYGMDQGQVSKWIKILEPVLARALKNMGALPARDIGELAKLFDMRQRDKQLPNSKPQARTLSADATDRPALFGTAQKRTIRLNERALYSQAHRAESFFWTRRK